MKKVFLTAFIIINSICMLQAQDNKAEEQAITNVLNTIQTGWNEKNGEKLASSFATEHDYIVVNGLYLKGWTREQNAKGHQRLFDGVMRNTNIRLKVDKISFYRNDLAHVTAIGAGHATGEAVPKDPTVIMTFIVEKKKEGWKIISFHNHELNMEAIKKGSPAPLEAVYASWYKN